MDELLDEVTVLCRELDPTRLFIVAEVDSVERADALIARAKNVCASKQRRKCGAGQAAKPEKV
jgi:hypothetical protein